MFKVIATLLCTLSLLLSSALELKAQDQSPNKTSKYALGGDLSLLFGSVTLINVSPKLGYRFSERFMAGPGIIYQYYKDRVSPPPAVQQADILGASGFARFAVTDQLALYTEYQQLTVSYSNAFGNQSAQVPVMFVGGQYFADVGSGFRFNITLLYDLLQSEFSPYPNNSYYGVGGFYYF